MGLAHLLIDIAAGLLLANDVLVVLQQLGCLLFVRTLVVVCWRLLPILASTLTPGLVQNRSHVTLAGVGALGHRILGMW